MIKSLQIKFVSIVMLSIIVISSGIFGILVIENLGAINKHADGLLNMIIENDGKLPTFKPQHMDKYNLINRETRYSTRFFTVKVDKSGDIISSDMKNIVTVSKDDVSEVLKHVILETGFYENFKYRVADKGDYKLIVFIDCATQIGSLRFMISQSITVISIVWIVVFILLIVTSKKILRPLTESVDKQKQFITNASHELKTPLAVINADIDVMEMTLPEENEWLFSIKKQVSRLDILVKSLLNLASVEEGRKRLNISEFSMTEVVKEEINDFKSLLIDKNVEFNDSQDYFVKADKELIKQVIVILIDNAIKYTTENGLIKIMLEYKGKELRFEIANTCDNPEDIDTNQIFDRFYRNDKSRNSKKKGFGIGLSIAKSIIDIHKGKISAFVNKEKQMCFRVILPKGNK